jgi:hypothetical protein
MLTWLARKLAAWYVKKYWGSRCKTIAKDCGGCEAWLMYDYLFTENWFEGETQTFEPTIYVPVSTKIEDLDDEEIMEKVKEFMNANHPEYQEIAKEVAEEDARY